VTIDDKHIEIIVAQMLRNVQVVESGDTDMLPGTIIDKFRFRRVNQETVKLGKKPATAEPLLSGSRRRRSTPRASSRPRASRRPPRC
jgi:DNA-directed RNA polymerase subunit beta'